MSSRKMLPILGVGSAFALLGLAAAHRRSRRSAPPLAGGARPSGFHRRVDRGATPDEASFEPVTLSQFWDAAPESGSMQEESRLEEPLTLTLKPSLPGESYDALDTEDLTAEWLARATQAPLFDDLGVGIDTDDPAEIAADSMSMISDASRKAAAFDGSGSDDDEDADGAASTRWNGQH
jgi:hypothetical protein